MTNIIPSEAIDLDEVAILLDIDGTILDFAPTPREVWVPPSLRRDLLELFERTNGALALVSGRSLNDMDLLFAPLQLPAIGGHGAEFRPASGAAPDVDRTPSLSRDLKRRLAMVPADIGPGILIEDKGYSLALHYRLAPDKGEAVRAAVSAICSGEPPGSVEMLPGKAVIEVKQMGFNKASAVKELLRIPPFAGRRPIFIGDDVTDEPVFPILGRFGGFGFSVGRRVKHADGCLARPSEVREWLKRVLARRKDASLRAVSAPPAG
jgi:trehalose 6-phosphate phosphatase